MATEAEKEAKIREQVARLRSLPYPLRKTIAHLFGESGALLIMALDVIDGYRARVDHLEGLLAQGQPVERSQVLDSQDIPRGMTEYANIPIEDAVFADPERGEKLKETLRELSNILNLEFPTK